MNILPETLCNKMRLMSLNEMQSFLEQFKSEYPWIYELLSERLANYPVERKHRYYKVDRCENL